MNNNENLSNFLVFQKCLQMTFQDESNVNKFEFQAPSVVYTDIHKAKKNVRCCFIHN